MWEVIGSKDFFTARLNHGVMQNVEDTDNEFCAFMKIFCFLSPPAAAASR